MGIEPTCSAWKADVLPLNYTRCVLSHPSTNHFISLQIKKLVLYLYRRYFFTNSYAMSQLVEGVGFEPTKAEPTDLQSAPVDRLGTPPKNSSRPFWKDQLPLSIHWVINCLRCSHYISWNPVPNLTWFQISRDISGQNIINFVGEISFHLFTWFSWLLTLGIGTGRGDRPQFTA